jgi:hypothetical protein
VSSAVNSIFIYWQFYIIYFIWKRLKYLIIMSQNLLRSDMFMLVLLMCVCVKSC